MMRSKKSAKDGEKSLRKFVALAFVDILISFIMDFDTYDSREVISSSVG